MNNQPAFPTVDANREEDCGTTGMTLRDYFAAKAMPHSLTRACWGADRQYASSEDLIRCQCEAAYEYADAMLKARNKQGDNK